ncbi:MAG: tRNA dimethylallyltransferase, partial [Butyricimonas paravirosa]
LDPVSYTTVDLKNAKRIMHALEVCLMTGKPYSSFLTGSVKEREFDIVKIGLNREREELFDRINRRVDQMVEDGMEEEARSLYPLRHLNALNTVGQGGVDYLTASLTGRLSGSSNEIPADMQKATYLVSQ